MNAHERVLIVEPDDALRLRLETWLRAERCDVRAAASGAGALGLLAHVPFDLVIADAGGATGAGPDLLRHIRDRRPDVPVILICPPENGAPARPASPDEAARASRVADLLGGVERAILPRRADRADAHAHAPGPPRIVAASPAMQAVMSLVDRAAASDAPVLLLGESGTGKELLARALHHASPRRRGPMLAVNCSAIPEPLLESQLFGYRRGAFTDAHDDHAGLFQEASGGTLFLDEIGDLALPLQGKLCRVLQEREVHPLGARAPVPVDARMVAATHRDLWQAAAGRQFREDLLYRINVITIRISPLRERPDDIEPLASHFLAKYAARAGRDGCRMSDVAMRLLRRHTWPGNVRELENTIWRALVLGVGPTVEAGDLPEVLRTPAAARPAPGAGALADVEREHILRTLGSVGGNKARAARVLGLDRKTLYRRLAQYARHNSHQ
jgi:DNA-binding NtrC family response regulator